MAEEGKSSALEGLKKIKPGWWIAIAGGGLGVLYLMSSGGGGTMSSGAVEVAAPTDLPVPTVNVTAPVTVVNTPTGTTPATPAAGSSTTSIFRKGDTVYTAGAISNPMLDNKRHAGFNLSRSTKLQILKRSGNSYQVKILSGANKGKTVYLSAKQLKRK